MSHKVSKLDIVTDLRRALSASYSPKGFSDRNYLIFLKKALENLKSAATKGKINPAVFERLNKAKDNKQPAAKRREDLLTASNIL